MLTLAIYYAHYYIQPTISDEISDHMDISTLHIRTDGFHVPCIKVTVEQYPTDECFDKLCQQR